MEHKNISGKSREHMKLQQVLSYVRKAVDDYQMIMDVEMFRIESPQAVERIQKRKAVLAAGDADGNLIPLLYHLIVVPP